MKICFTGGGTLGHVYPALAIKENLEKVDSNFECYWIGRNNDTEQSIIKNSGIDFYPISCGKLRRYFSISNFIDVFKVFIGYRQSIKLLKKNRVDLVFSKGGFVSVPVVYAAHRLKIPIVTHESDKTLGLATKLDARVCNKVCLGFKIDGLNPSKYIFTGNPLRSSLLKWSHFNSDEQLNTTFLEAIEKDKRFSDFYNRFQLKFKEDKPLILVMGGSLGSLEINNMVFDNLNYLTEHYNVFHQMGSTYKEIQKEGYFGVKSIEDELGFLYFKCSLCISRAGAGTLNEIINLGVNSLLIPLRTNASRGEQIINSEYFEKKGCVSVLHSRENSQEFIDSIINLIDNKEEAAHRKTMEFSMANTQAAFNICEVITEVIKE